MEQRLDVVLEVTTILVHGFSTTKARNLIVLLSQLQLAMIPQVLFIQGVHRGLVLTMVGLQVLFIQGVQRSMVLIMTGLQVLFMPVVQRGIVQIVAEMQAALLNGIACVYRSHFHTHRYIYIIYIECVC